MIDLFKIKEDFSFLVKEAEPWTLTQFVMWLDLKLSEFKTKGYMILDHQIKTKPKWLEEEAITSDVAPPQAPCRTCNSSKSSTRDRDVGQYFSDIHASRPVHRQTSGNQQNTAQQKSTDESENIRGEVGIIDLSHMEVQNRAKNNNFRQNTNQSSAILPGANYRPVPTQGYQRQKSLPSTASSRSPPDKRARPEIIEIDGSSPTEKMFVTASRPEIGRTSTPIARRAGQLLQKAKNRQSLSMGSPIFTSTTTSLTSTFSSSFTAKPTRTVPATQSRNYALGAPPVSSFGSPPVSTYGGQSLSSFGTQPVSSSSFPLSSSVESQIKNLDELIAQTVQSVSAQNRLSTEIPPTTQQSFDTISYSSEQQIKGTTSPVQHQTSFSDTNTVGQQPSETVFPGVSISPSIFSQITDGQAVPVALHANIDNINRDLSTSVPSSSDGTEVKMESELNPSISDSFITEGGPLPTSVTDTTSDISQSFDCSLTPQGQGDPGGVPRPGLVDPDTARAYQMVELVAGSGVYVYDKTISQAFKVGTERETGTYSGEKMARYLLNVFWSRKDLVGATLSKAGRGKKILNQQIIEAILDYCEANSHHPKSKARAAMTNSITSITWHAKQKIKQKFGWNENKFFGLQ